MGNINPFRYRGYYYDEETGFYYLKTRYYDPEIGRFITIDDTSYLDPDSVNGLNLYAYCGNNPVMNVDPEGTSWWSNFWNSVGNWFVRVKTTVGEFVSNNWDLIVGGILVVAGIVVGIVTFGAGTVIAGVVCGAILGGALSAYSRGENILGGFLNGFIVGALGGISPWAGVFAAAGMSFIMDRINGVKANGLSFVRAALNASVAGLLAFGSNSFANLMIDGSKELIVRNVASFVSSFIFSGYSFVADSINSLFWSNK